LEEEILEMSIDFEKEKKANIRLAIGVACLGVAGFFAVYIFSFLIMIYSPGWFFNLFPFPSFSESVVGFKGNLFLFSKSIKFKGRSFENPPEEKMTLKIFDGKSVSEPREIKTSPLFIPLKIGSIFLTKDITGLLTERIGRFSKTRPSGVIPRELSGRKGYIF